jgi:hypothetical protein
MKYAVEMASGGMIYVQRDRQRDTHIHTHRARRSNKPTFNISK